MKNNYIFDTCFLSSLLNTKDVNHKQALRMLMDAPKNLCVVIPATVRLEIAIYKQQRPAYMQVSFRELFRSLSVEYINIDEGFIKKL